MTDRVPGPSDHLQHHEEGSVPSPTWKDKARGLGSEIRVWVGGQKSAAATQKSWFMSPGECVLNHLLA